MASITLTVPDAIAQRVTDAVCTRYGYQATILDVNNNLIQNPMTKAQFVKRVIYQHLKRIVVAYEIDLAVKSAEDAARTTAETDITFEL